MKDTFNFLKDSFKGNKELADTILNWNDISYVLPLMYIDIRIYACNQPIDNIVELGTRGGESTVALYSAVYEINTQLDQSAKMTSIDISPECESVRTRLERIGPTDWWTFITGDSAKVEWSDPIDFLLIDTSHEYEQTLKELNKWTPFIKQGGTVWMHDVSSTKGVPEAIHKWLSEQPKDTWKYYEVPTYAGLAWLKKL